jgi:hypothetical protein
MSFVIVNTKYGTLERAKNGMNSFAEERHAKTAVAAKMRRRNARVASGMNPKFELADGQLKIMTAEAYRADFAQTKKVRNLMSGKEIEISVNTPGCCDPSQERYWSC